MRRPARRVLILFVLILKMLSALRIKTEHKNVNVRINAADNEFGQKDIAALTARKMLA